MPKVIDPKVMLGTALLDLCQYSRQAGMEEIDICHTLFHALCSRVATALPNVIMPGGKSSIQLMAGQMSEELPNLVAKYFRATMAADSMPISAKPH